MSLLVTRVGEDDVDTNGYTPDPASIGAAQQNFCSTSGVMWALDGEDVQNHSLGPSTHINETILATSSVTFVDGIAVARISDTTTNTPAHIVESAGSTNFVYSD